MMAKQIKDSADFGTLCEEINDYVGRKVDVRVIGADEKSRSGLKEIQLVEAVKKAFSVDIEIED